MDGSAGDCVFCRIAAGDAFARIVYETDSLICFFPRVPELPGHTLIVSRAHYADIGDCPDGFGAEVFAACRTLAGHYAPAIGATGFNLMNASGRDAGQSVPHLHFHFLPRLPGDGLDTWPALPPFAADLDDLANRLSVPD